MSEDKPKVAVLGASKFGRWHVREFRDAGCDVVAILGSSEDSARITAEKLNSMFGVNPVPYWDFREMLGCEELDAVSIVTPPDTHFKYAMMALKQGLDVLLEKPPVTGFSPEDAVRNLCRLIEEHKTNFECRRNKSLFAMQQQHAASLAQFSEILGSDLRDVEVFTYKVKSAGNLVGYELATDQFPHPLSILTRLKGHGRIVPNGIRDIYTNGPVKVSSEYVTGDSRTRIDFEVEQVPGLSRENNEMSFGFDNQVIERRQSGEGNDLRQVYVHDGKEYEVNDPLSLSISRFVNRNPVVSAQDGLNSLMAQMVLQHPDIATVPDDVYRFRKFLK